MCLNMFILQKKMFFTPKNVKSIKIYNFQNKANIISYLRLLGLNKDFSVKLLTRLFVIYGQGLTPK